MALPRLAPLELDRVAAPFDHTEALYELKHDGFRALLYLEEGKVQLVSRKGVVYKSYAPLCAELAETIILRDAIIDGELVCLDQHGHSQFYDMMRRRQQPIFYAFDLLYSNGVDRRDLPLLHRKSLMSRQLPTDAPCFLQAQYIIGRGVDLFNQVCAVDGEGVVAKWTQSPYARVKGISPWVKILNPAYTQREGRAEIFNRKRR